jgi:hypothetical protein
MIVINWKLDWKDPMERRKFFEKYAHDHGFDPFNSEKWYLQRRKHIMATKVQLFWSFKFCDL